MKKLTLACLIALCLLGFQQANAQVDVTINPLGLLFGDFSAGADFVLHDNFSVEATVGYGGGKNDATSLKYYNVPVNLVGKYYFSPNHGGDRFYGDVFLRFVSRNYSAEDGSAYAAYKQTRFGVGFGLGYKVVSNKGLVFDFGFGAGRSMYDNTKYEDSNGTQTQVDWPKIMFQGKLGLGYRFGGGKK